MQDIRFQVSVKEKTELPMPGEAIQYTLIVRPDDQAGITGQLNIEVSSPETGELVETGKTFDVVMTPHLEGSA